MIDAAFADLDPMRKLELKQRIHEMAAVLPLLPREIEYVMAWLAEEALWRRGDYTLTPQAAPVIRLKVVGGGAGD